MGKCRGYLQLILIPIRAKLRETGLGGAYLIRAKLDEANLTRAYLIRAKLREANLRETDLSRANLSGANLREAQLKDSEVTNTKFSSNSPGMTEKLKQDLIQRGAIFEDSLEDPLILTPVGR